MDKYLDEPIHISHARAEFELISAKKVSEMTSKELERLAQVRAEIEEWETFVDEQNKN